MPTPRPELRGVACKAIIDRVVGFTVYAEAHKAIVDRFAAFVVEREAPKAWPRRALGHCPPPGPELRGVACKAIIDRVVGFTVYAEAHKAIDHTAQPFVDL